MTHMTIYGTISVPFDLAAAERILVVEALRRCGCIIHAAELLGISRHALQRRIVKHGIRVARESGRVTLATVVLPG